MTPISAKCDPFTSKYLTVDEALTNVGITRFHIRILLCAGLMWYSDALEVQLLSVLGPAVRLVEHNALTISVKETMPLHFTIKGFCY